MNDLKPCPFCGGEAKTSNERFERTLLSWVYCTSCGSAGGYRNTEQEAIEAWNTRAERTCRVVPHGYCIANGEETSCRCWSCSECSYGWHISDYDKQYKFCPNCGAKVVSE